jgi:amidase
VLTDADRLDAALKATGKLTGPLHGIPLIVEDNLDTFDLPTTSGVVLFKDFVPPKDAFVVKRVREAGAIILAKASLSEMAMGLADSINSVLPGFTRNPYNTAYASGGSSGGTGVAIAANFGTVGIGTDTGGSVRAPASFWIRTARSAAQCRSSASAIERCHRWGWPLHFARRTSIPARSA